MNRSPYFRRRGTYANGCPNENKWDLVERATGRVIGTIERESYPTCRGGSSVSAWTATDLDGRRVLCSRLGDAVLALQLAQLTAPTK